MKVGRNEPCPCGIGQKFKRCHGRLGRGPLPTAEDVKLSLEAGQARERIREAQQGQGRPIVAPKIGDVQMVSVGKTMHWSKNWKSFSDFLADYMTRKLGSDWGKAEIAKPFNERHPIMQWHDAFCRQFAKIGRPGEVRSSTMTGAIACYFGAAYGLYLLEHNVELQDRMIRRLKDSGQFQGAYYELLVARTLILSGFELTLEDETDGNAKHCEFAAVSKATGKKYWIEAKMRAVEGLLGRTAADGSNSPNAIRQLVKHLNSALGKPAADARMIFIDVNTDMPADVSDENRPQFVRLATGRLNIYEKRELSPGESAYVFVTNLNFHRDLEGPPQIAAFPFGLGMPDFNRPGRMRMHERYKQEKKHADALRAADGILQLLTFPITFDGSLPGVTLKGERPPIVIGQEYVFNGAGKDGEDLTGIVADATVMEADKHVMIAVNGTDGTGHLLREPMTDAQLADYKAHPDAYFGKVVRPPKMLKNAYELFLFMMDSYRELSREQLLERLAGKVSGAESMDDEELLATYCEGMTFASKMFKPVDGLLRI